MDPSWIEFQAEYEPIKIVPNFTAPRVDLLQDDYGPFKGIQVLYILYKK